MRTRIKFCGITRKQDALIAAELGVDAIGMIFVKNSKRCVAIRTASEIVRALPPFITSVAVVANMTATEIATIIAEVPIDLLQFHGAEDAAFCAQFNKPYIKTIAMPNETPISEILQQYPQAQGFLFDTQVRQQLGGSGLVFDWQLIPKNIAPKIILAGGLSPENVSLAINKVQPYAVDVASGIEVAPGVKDQQKMRAFVAAVQATNTN